MKEAIQPDASQAQKTAEPARSWPAQKNTTVSGGHLAQLAAMMNSSSRVQTLAQLQDDIQQRPPVQGLLGLTESFNQSQPNRDVPAQPYKQPVAQLGKKKRREKSKQPKKSVKKSERGVSHEAPEKRLEEETQWSSGAPDISYHVIAQEGGEPTVYEEEYDAPQIFWRGDTRGPDAVFDTGFTSSHERAGTVAKGANRIIWRGGGELDDILPASAVCMAKDIRGGSFFPLTGEQQFYLYAVGKTRIVNTFKAQKHAEATQTGESDFRREERYQYDPAYADEESASAVWQFQEYAAHRVEPNEILAAFKVFRRTLVPAGGGASVAIAGVQFRLEFDRFGPIGNARSKALQKQMSALANQARSMAAEYEDFYPDKEQFLSYMGLVKPKNPQSPPQNLAEAREKVRQVQPVVVQEKHNALLATETSAGVLTQLRDDPVSADGALECETNSMGARTLGVQLLRAPAQLVKWKDEEIAGLTEFTASLEDESEEEKVQRIKGELTPLSKFSGVTFNCYAWAMGDITFNDPGDKLKTWKHRLSKEYDFLDQDDANAAILLWGEEEGDDWEIRHASVKLTHAQLKDRKAGTYSDSLEYDKETLAALEDPFWSSAMGFGFGVAAHPKEFFDGGDFGKPVAGMRKK